MRNCQQKMTGQITKNKNKIRLALVLSKAAFDQKYSDIIKLNYNLKEMFFSFEMSFIPVMAKLNFSAVITPGFSVTWSFRHHFCDI